MLLLLLLLLLRTVTIDELKVRAAMAERLRPDIKKDISYVCVYMCGGSGVGSRDCLWMDEKEKEEMKKKKLFVDDLVGGLTEDGLVFWW